MPMHFLSDFVNDYLELVTKHYGGDITVNQIRILHFIARYIAERGDYATHSAICRCLGLPAATVTRAVTTFVEKGVLKEATDPKDARRRCIRFADNHAGKEMRTKALELAQKHLDRAAALHRES